MKTRNQSEVIAEILRSIVSGIDGDGRPFANLPSHGYQVKIIETSLNPLGGNPLMTVQVTYPRMVHSELMTHRQFSRNASSSRAIPVARMLDQVCKNPARPLVWGVNQPGMQSKLVLVGKDADEANRIWTSAAQDAATTAYRLGVDLGLHKQVANRVLEPYQFIHVIITGTEWENFFSLRDHEDADPTIFALARLISIAFEIAVDNGLTVRPVDVSSLSHAAWHLPYVTAEERETLPLWQCIAASVARCARVSYLTHDGMVPSLEKDLALFERLVGSVPLHASPIEHQACVSSDEFMPSRNIVGFTQFREVYEIGLELGENTIEGAMAAGLKYIQEFMQPVLVEPRP